MGNQEKALGIRIWTAWNTQPAESRAAGCMEEW